MRNFKDFTRAVAGIATSLKNINTVVEAIPVPSGGGSSADYSSDEKLVGKWIDGSDLYERVFTATGIDESTTSNLDVSSEMADTANQFIHEAIFVAANSTLSINPYFTVSYHAESAYHTNNNKIEYVCRGYGSYTAYFVVRYTKTSE